MGKDIAVASKVGNDELFRGDPEIIKSNELVAADIDDWPLKDAQVLAVAISRIPRDADPNQKITVKIYRSELDAMFGLNGMGYRRLHALAQRIQKRQATIPPRDIEIERDLFGDEFDAKDKEKSWDNLVLIPTCRYRRSSGVFIIEFHQELNQHFLQLRDRFTTYRLANVIGLRSSYHIRLYEILVSRIERGEKIYLAIERLREMLGLKGRYPVFREMRRRVVEPAVEGITAHTDLNVSMEPKKHGRHVVGIEFNVTKKAEAERFRQVVESSAIPGAPVDEKTVAIIMEAGIPRASALKLAEGYQDTEEALRDSIEAAKEYVEDQRRKEKGHNPVKITYKAIKEGWTPRDLFADPGQKKKVDQKKHEGEHEEWVREQLHSNEEMQTWFINYLTKRKDQFSIDSFRDGGVHSTDATLQDRITEFASWMRMVKQESEG